VLCVIMIESRIIGAGKVVGFLLVGCSLVRMFHEDVLISESSIEYGIILLGIACSIGAIRNKRTSHNDTKNS